VVRRRPRSGSRGSSNFFSFGSFVTVLPTRRTSFVFGPRSTCFEPLTMSVGWLVFSNFYDFIDGAWLYCFFFEFGSSTQTWLFSISFLEIRFHSPSSCLVLRFNAGWLGTAFFFLPQRFMIVSCAFLPLIAGIRRHPGALACFFLVHNFAFMSAWDIFLHPLIAHDRGLFAFLFDRGAAGKCLESLALSHRVEAVGWRNALASFLFFF